MTARPSFDYQHQRQWYVCGCWSVMYPTRFCGCACRESHEYERAVRHPDCPHEGESVSDGREVST